MINICSALKRTLAIGLVFCLALYPAVAVTDTPYPPIGVPWSKGSTWGASYTVGTGPNALIQLDSRGRLPAVDGSQLFNISGSSGEMTYPPAGVALSTGSAWGHSYGVGVAPNDLVQLDPGGLLPSVDGSQLVNLTNLKFGYFTDPLAPGQIAIDNQTGALVFHPGGSALQQALIFSGVCPAGSTLVTDGHGIWTCGTVGGMVYPPAGVPFSTGSAWGASYEVDTGAHNIVQLDSQGRLPDLDGSLD